MWPDRSDEHDEYHKLGNYTYKIYRKGALHCFSRGASEDRKDMPRKREWRKNNYKYYGFQHASDTVFKKKERILLSHTDAEGEEIKKEDAEKPAHSVQKRMEDAKGKREDRISRFKEAAMKQRPREKDRSRTRSPMKQVREVRQKTDGEMSPGGQ